MKHYIHKKNVEKHVHWSTHHLCYKCTHTEKRCGRGAKGPLLPTLHWIRWFKKNKIKGKSRAVAEKLPGSCVFEGGAALSSLPLSAKPPLPHSLSGHGQKAGEAGAGFREDALPVALWLLPAHAASHFARPGGARFHQSPRMLQGRPGGLRGRAVPEWGEERVDPVGGGEQQRILCVFVWEKGEVRGVVKKGEEKIEKKKSRITRKRNSGEEKKYQNKRREKKIKSHTHRHVGWILKREKGKGEEGTDERMWQHLNTRGRSSPARQSWRTQTPIRASTNQLHHKEALHSYLTLRTDFKRVSVIRSSCCWLVEAGF